jgi:hypothetical protein
MNGQALSIDAQIDRDGDVITRVRARFGPHFVVEVRADDSRISFELVATHHGFTAEASEIGGELERIIEEVRRAHPELAVD